ncbi:molybdenum cofactor guanylyltransferase MobA [Zhongshania sp. BJYM1]|uniref:molybdenum cofactor guanylyltransferase MobA n=1 Tax=Zhongshania aquatica TaxID=2965069 RepID=UPI0022B503C2|nr:molybdenum cofactor guanylyltransferase MobA [Marortus sp. BJYM1]
MLKNSICIRDVTALILAGGEGRRMNGQDKGLLVWKGRPLIEHVLEAVPSEVSSILISCNRNFEQYEVYGDTIRDANPTFEGPLAGISAAMQTTSKPLMLILPCDSPLVPADIYYQLATTLNESDADICYVNDGEREQYLFALMRTELKSSLQEYIQAGNRQVNRWYKQHNTVEVRFSDRQGSFKNCNTIDELDELN